MFRAFDPDATLALALARLRACGFDLRVSIGLRASVRAVASLGVNVCTTSIVSVLDVDVSSYIDMVIQIDP